MMYDELPLIDNRPIHNFELIIEGQRAFIDYRQKENTVLLVHTEVPVALEGRGVASALVEKTFRHLEANNLKMLPYCEYIKAFLKRRPEWKRLLAG